IPLAPLALKDRQRVGNGPVAVPAEPCIEQVEPERSFTVRDIEEYHFVRALIWHQAKHRLRQISVWVNEKHGAARLCLHRKARQSLHQRRLSTTRFCDQEQVAPQHIRRQGDWYLAPLVARRANRAAFGDRAWQRQPLPGAGTLE